MMFPLELEKLIYYIYYIYYTTICNIQIDYKTIGGGPHEIKAKPDKEGDPVKDEGWRLKCHGAQYLIFLRLLRTLGERDT